MAQWLAQATHNRLVAGSNPAGPTFWASFKDATITSHNNLTEGMGEDKLSVLEKESLIYAKQRNDDDLRKLIAQARAIVGYR